MSKMKDKVARSLANKANTQLSEMATQVAALTNSGVDTVARAAMSENKNIQHSMYSPIVVFITDDGSIQDYNILKPISETYVIPFVTAQIAGTLQLTQTQLLYLQNTLGWEIASHTVSHVDMSTLATEALIDTECANSKTILTTLGLNVKNMVYPFGGNDERVRRIAKKYYRSGVTVFKNSQGINVKSMPTFNINRVALGSYFDTTTSGYPSDTTSLAYYKARVDQAVANNGLLIFMLHPANASFDATQQSYLTQTIQYIQGLNVPIMTLDKALDVFENAFESGDYYQNNTSLTGSGGVAIDKNGDLINFPINFIKISKTGLNNASLVTSFPSGVSTTSFLNADGAGFPVNAGTLVTYRIDSNDDLSFQLFYGYSSNTSYKRYCLSGSWGTWESNPVGFSPTNTYTSAQLITAFPVNKTTSCFINSSNSTGFPNNQPGILTTYNTNNRGIDRQEYRVYNTNQIWSRYVNVSDGSWTPWVNITLEQPTWNGVIAMNANTFTVLGTTKVNNFVDFEKIFSTGGTQITLSKTLWAKSEISTDSGNPTTIGTAGAINLLAYLDASNLLYVKYSASGNNYNTYYRTSFC